MTVPWWKFWRSSGRTAPDYYREGIALAREERYHEALTSFRLALRERPDDPATLEQMAVVYTQIGVTDEAVKLYRRALELRPSAAAHYGLAFLLLRRGEPGEAAAHLRAFLADADDAPEKHVRHARQTLARLEGAEGEEGEGEGGEAEGGSDGAGRRGAGGGETGAEGRHGPEGTNGSA